MSRFFSIFFKRNGQIERHDGQVERFRERRERRGLFEARLGKLCKGPVARGCGAIVVRGRQRPVRAQDEGKGDIAFIVVSAVVRLEPLAYLFTDKLVIPYIILRVLERRLLLGGLFGKAVDRLLL